MTIGCPPSPTLSHTNLHCQENAVPLIPVKDHWRIPVIITANIVPPSRRHYKIDGIYRLNRPSFSMRYRVRFKYVRIATQLPPSPSTLSPLNGSLCFVSLLAKQMDMLVQEGGYVWRRYRLWCW